MPYILENLFDSTKAIKKSASKEEIKKFYRTANINKFQKSFEDYKRKLERIIDNPNQKVGPLLDLENELILANNVISILLSLKNFRDNVDLNNYKNHKPASYLYVLKTRVDALKSITLSDDNKKIVASLEKYVDESVKFRLERIDDHIRKEKGDSVIANDLLMTLWNTTSEELKKVAVSPTLSVFQPTKGKEHYYNMLKPQPLQILTTATDTAEEIIVEIPEDAPIQLEENNALFIESFPNTEWEFQSELGRGCFGKVCEYNVNGTLFNELKKLEVCDQNNNKVAAKTLILQNASPTELVEFIKEGNITNKMRLAYIEETEKNPNLPATPFIVPGHLASDNQTPMIIMRHIGGRSDNYLKKLNADPGKKGDEDRALLIGKWMMQMSRGLKRVHEQKFIHRDMAARNILIDKNGNAYISDFGLAVVMDDNQKASEKETNGPLRWLDRDRFTDKATPLSDFFGIRATLLEHLIAITEIDHSFLTQDPIEDYYKKVIKDGETKVFEDFYDEMNNKITAKLSTITEEKEKARLEQALDLLHCFEVFLKKDNGKSGLTINQRLTNNYLNLIQSFNKLAEIKKRSTDLSLFYNPESIKDLAEAALSYALKSYHESRKDEAAKNRFKEDINILEQLVSKPPISFNTQTFQDSKKMIASWSSPQTSPAPTVAEVNVMATAPTQPSETEKKLETVYGQNDIISSDIEAEENEGIKYSDKELELITKILESGSESESESDIINTDLLTTFPADKSDTPLSSLQVVAPSTHTLPESELGNLYKFVKNQDNKVANYSFDEVKKQTPIFATTDIKSLLNFAHQQIQSLKKNGFKVYNYKGQEFLIKFNENQKLDDLNPIHRNEAEIQALRYLRGMFYIAQNIGSADQSTFITKINDSWNKYLNSTTADASKKTRELYESFAKNLAAELGIDIKKARKQVSIARDLGITLESHPPICTLSKINNNQLTLEQADLVKIRDSYYNTYFKDISNQAWYKHAEENAGLDIDKKDKKTAKGRDWLTKFYDVNFDELQAKGIPTPSSLRFDPRPANLQKIAISTTTLKEDDSVDDNAITSTSVYRLATLAPPKIHDDALQLEYAISELKVAIESTLQGALQDFYNKYGTILKPNEIPDFYINNLSLLSPWKNEKLIPSSVYDDNNGRFVDIAKKAMDVIANSSQELAVKVTDKSGNQQDLKVKLHFSQTNAAINKRTQFKIKKLVFKNFLIETYKEDKKARFEKVESSEKFLRTVLATDTDVASLTKEQVDAEVKKLKAGNDNKYQHLDKKLQLELAVRLQATHHLRDLLQDGKAYKGLSIYQRNIMMVALEDLALGNQTLTFAGCKSARDRTAIFMAAIKTMLENPDAMHNWAILNTGINRALIQGHHFRAMLWHNATVKIGAVGSFFFKELPGNLQKAITNNVFSKPFGNPEEHEKKLQEKLLKIEGGKEEKRPAVDSFAPPVITLTPEEIAARKASNFKNNIVEIYQTENEFRNQMKSLVNFFLDENGKLKPDSTFLNSPAKLSDAMRYKLEQFLLVYKSLAEENPFEGKDQNIDTIIQTFQNPEKITKLLQKATLQKKDIDEFDTYIKTIGGFKSINGETLDSLSSKPFQRLGKYPLFLNNLATNAPDKKTADAMISIASKFVTHLDQFNNTIPKDDSQLFILKKQVEEKIAAIKAYKNTVEDEKKHSLFKDQYSKRITALNKFITELEHKPSYEEKLNYIKSIENINLKELKDQDSEIFNLRKTIDTHIGPPMPHLHKTAFRLHLQKDTAGKKGEMGLGLMQKLTTAIEAKQSYENKIATEYATKYNLPQAKDQNLDDSIVAVLTAASRATQAARSFGNGLLRYDQRLFAQDRLVREAERGRVAPTNRLNNLRH